jgi:hypothetical protein
VVGLFSFTLEVMNNVVTAEPDETAAVKLSELLLGHGCAVWMDNFYNSPEFMKSKTTDCVGTLCANRKNVPPVKVKKLSL